MSGCLQQPAVGPSHCGAIMQQPRPNCLARRDVAPRAHHPHPVQPLDLVGPVSIALEYASIGIIRRARDERDLMPPLDQVGGEFSDQHRTADILRRIELRHEHDVHRPQSPPAFPL